MRIIKTPMDIYRADTIRKIANAGCNVCPFCGEKKSWDEYMEKGELNKGILSGGLVARWIEGFFRPRYMQADFYRCNTCGAEWESEPYEV